LGGRSTTCHVSPTGHVAWKWTISRPARPVAKVRISVLYTLLTPAPWFAGCLLFWLLRCSSSMRPRAKVTSIGRWIPSWATVSLHAPASFGTVAAREAGCGGGKRKRGGDQGQKAERFGAQASGLAADRLSSGLLLHRLAGDARMLYSARNHGVLTVRPHVFSHPRVVSSGSSHSVRANIGETNDRSVTMKYNVQGMLA
jgi:hypothetical protein